MAETHRRRGSAFVGGPQSLANGAPEHWTATSPVTHAEPVPSPRWHVYVAALLAFILAASNGKPASTSSGIFVILLGGPLFLLRHPDRLIVKALSRPNQNIFLGLLLFLLGNLLSLALAPTDDAIAAVLQRCILPLIVYLSLLGLVLRREDVVLLVFAFAAGACVMYVKGSVAYFREFGIPDLHTILWARFDVERIRGYAEATLGNVGHLGSYVVLLFPAVALTMMKLLSGWKARGLLMSAIALGFANLIVSGSRAGLAIFILISLALFLTIRPSRQFAVGAVLMGAAVLSMPEWIGLLGDKEFIDRYLPALGDQRVDASAVERWESIVIGWQIFLEHMALGVGPGMSPHYNMHFIPHASIPHQLSELGILGGGAFILLNVIVISAAAVAYFKMRLHEAFVYRFLWLSGPAAWFVFGIFAGITFSASYALVWVGLAHAMLALSGARVLLNR